MTWRGVVLVMVVGAVGCHSKIDILGEDGGGGGRDAQPPSDFAVPDDDGTAGCAAPAPKCYQGWSMSSDCCLEPGSEATCEGDAWVCPTDTFFEGECGRIDPVCEGADMGRPPVLYDNCGATEDCVLTGRYCCPTCGEVNADDLVSVNRTLVDDHYLNEACPEAREGEVLCPDCPEGYNPHLAAFCDPTGIRAACAVLDLGDASYRTCADDSDCVLSAATCCPCGDVPETETISVRRDVDVAALLCDDACDCEPVFGDGVSATCVTGLCTVAYGARTDP
ncbi:MAG: hypothetical protein JJ863_05415 [Deltaproteobacteria bacterium]|nr:hypothetical protein [Deltaproteobacteria bacterium]